MSFSTRRRWARSLLRQIPFCLHELDLNGSPFYPNQSLHPNWNTIYMIIYIQPCVHGLSCSATCQAWSISSSPHNKMHSKGRGTKQSEGLANRCKQVNRTLAGDPSHWRSCKPCRKRPFSRPTVISWETCKDSANVSLLTPLVQSLSWYCQANKGCPKIPCKPCKPRFLNGFHWLHSFDKFSRS